MIKKWNKIIKYLKNPMAAFVKLGSMGFFNWMSDEIYLKIAYWTLIGKKLNLKNPKTFNEKLQWLKLHDRKNIYNTIVDKYEVKKYVADIIGSQYVIPMLGVWDKFDDIDFKKLPSQFVLKCTHDSGGVVVCSDISKFDYKAARKKINKSLNHNYYWKGREWPYKDLKPRIIAEKYIEDTEIHELYDYKFFCFHGVPHLCYIVTDRHFGNDEIKCDFFDMDFNHLPLTNSYPNTQKTIKCPQSFEEMKKLAAILSVNIPHIRVDFYEINGKIFFGELTLTSSSGFLRFSPVEWDKKIGDLLHLSPNSVQPTSR